MIYWIVPEMGTDQELARALCSHEAIFSLGLIASAWKPDSKHTCDSPTMRLCDRNRGSIDSCILWSLPVPSIPSGSHSGHHHLVSCDAILSTQEPPPSSHTHLSLLFPHLRAGTTSALTELNLSHSYLWGSPASESVWKPSLFCDFSSSFLNHIHSPSHSSCSDTLSGVLHPSACVCVFSQMDY